MTPLFRFLPREGVAGGFEATGAVPEVLATLEGRGEHVGRELFSAGPDR